MPTSGDTTPIVKQLHCGPRLEDETCGEQRNDIQTGYGSAACRATSKGGLILDERGGVSYPDGFQAPDASIYVSYDWNRSEKGHILFAKFTESDIRAGKLVSDDSRLRQTIMIPGKMNPKKTGE